MLNVGLAIRSLLQFRTLWYLLPSYLFNVICSILLNVLVFEPCGITKELSNENLFRPLKEMLYHPFVSPLVHSTLFLLLSNAVFGESVVRSWSVAAAIQFSALVWACTSLHGIWLDYTTFKISAKVFVCFLVGSFVSSLVTGYCLASFY